MKLKKNRLNLIIGLGFMFESLSFLIAGFLLSYNVFWTLAIYLIALLLAAGVGHLIKKQGVEEYLDART